MPSLGCPLVRNARESMGEARIAAEIGDLCMRDPITARVIEGWPRLSRTNSLSDARRPELSPTRGDAAKLCELICSAAITKLVASAAAHTRSVALASVLSPEQCAPVENHRPLDEEDARKVARRKAFFAPFC